MSSASGDGSAKGVACHVARAIMARHTSNVTLLVGVNGAQGSGKSTLAAWLADELDAHDCSTAILSLDDFYLPKAERQKLGGRIHTLCRTRGVPGTHDCGLLGATIDLLSNASPAGRTALPHFDKLADDRQSVWGVFIGRPDVIVLEGWCVGIRAEDLPVYSGPINELEAQSDPHGVWYQWSLTALTRDYAPLWDKLDMLVSIEVPGIETVIASRFRQEQGLEATTGRKGMDRAAVQRFVQHYERFTRAGWAAMPERADLLFRRDDQYNFALVGGQ